MNLKKITWEDKVALEDLTDVEENNKVTALNMNEIKDVVNNNGDYTVNEINRLQTQINQINYVSGTGIDIRDKTINIDSDHYTKWNNYENLINETVSKIDSSTTSLNQKINLINSNIDDLTVKVGQNNQSITEKVNLINSSIEEVNNDINKIKIQLSNKQNKFTIGEGLQSIENLLSIQSQLLTKWNGYQELIQTNQTNIEKNNDAIDTLNNDIKEINKLIQQIINGFQQLPVFEIVGDWVSGIIYRKNQAVYHNKKLWNSKVDNNTTEPTEENINFWFLISSFEIPINNLVTNDDLNNALRLKQDVLSGFNGVVVSQENKQVSIESNLLTKWNGYQELIQTNQGEIAKTNNNVDLNKQEIVRIDKIVGTNSTNIVNLDKKVNTNMSEINNLKEQLNSKQNILSFEESQFTVLNNNISLNDNFILTFNNQIKDLTTSINQLKEYAKTGIIQIVIWNQNGYRIRLIPILTPPSLIGRENEFLNRIHVSTTTYKQNNSSNPTIFSEYEGGEYVEIKNPRMNTDIIVNSLNTNNFRDNNISMNLYIWNDMNQNLISPVGNWAPKLIVPITSRYDRNGQVVYLVYKSIA